MTLVYEQVGPSLVMIPVDKQVGSGLVMILVDKQVGSDLSKVLVSNMNNHIRQLGNIFKIACEL